MIALISFEFEKLFRKWRTYIGFIAIAILIPIIQLALYFEGQNTINFYTQGISKSFVFVGNLLNGYLVANIVLQMLFFHIPFLIVLVGGDLLAGEATAGTYRMLITKPVSRFQIVTSKFIVGVIYSTLLVVWLAIISLLVSTFIFGTGELIVLKDKVYIFASNDVLWRFIYAYCFAILSMIMVFALSFFFSSLVENAIGPIISTMAVIIVFIIISAVNVDMLNEIKPYLFTTYINKWRSFFNDPVDYSEIIKSGIIVCSYIVGLYGLTLYIFNKKDILS